MTRKGLNDPGLLCHDPVFPIKLLVDELPTMNHERKHQNTNVEPFKSVDCVNTL